MIRGLIILIITFLLVGCPTREVPKPIPLPKIDENYTTILDENTQFKSILDKHNYIKPYNDMGVKIENINSGDMILSSILNFSRTSSRDKFGILQPDKIFSNLVDLHYLELPLSHSNIKLALLELLGNERTTLYKYINKLKELEIHYDDRDDNVSITGKKIENDELGIDLGNKSKELRSCKDIKSLIKTDKNKYHDRAMVSNFAQNDSELTGFTSITKSENLILRYVQKCQDNNKTYNETFSLIKKTISELIDSKADVVSMSIKLFDKDKEVNNFLTSSANLKDISSYNKCIKNNNCSNDKFIWVISLGNLDNNESTPDKINSAKEYKKFHHTKFITTVTGVSSDIDNNKSIIFYQQGKQFINAKKDELDYFSINLPKKTLHAYTDNELKMTSASTSYATAIFSAIVYNLYSLNLFLTEADVTNILKDTAYNQGCEELKSNDYVSYKIGIDEKNFYKIDCSKHRPSHVGYIVNMREAYKKAVRLLIDRHNEAFFAKGDINSSLYRNDSIIEKTRVIDENTYLVKTINIADKNLDNMNLGTAEIIGDVDIQFSKDKIVCRYEQSFSADNGSYYDRTFKEITLMYDDDGKPYIAFERNLFSK